MFRSSIVVAVALASAGCEEPPTPTEKEVRAAVEAWFADGPARDEARAAIERWGDDALPALRRLTDEKVDEPGGYALVCAIEAIETEAALSSLLDLLSDGTGMFGEYALTQIYADLATPLTWTKPFLAGDERFRSAVERRLAPPPPGDVVLGRTRAISIVAAMGWDDLSPRLEELLSDDDVAVREEAARALERLTGRPMNVEPAPLAFPAERIVDALVERGPDLPVEATWSREWSSFTRDADGRPVWFAGAGRERARLRGDATVADLETLPRYAHGVIGVPSAADARVRAVLLAADGEHGNATHLVALDDSSETVWEFRPPNERIADGAPSFGPDGVDGVVVAPGGEDGVVALDLRGEERWRLPKRRVVYGLATHEALPARVLVVAGSLELVRVDGGAPLVVASNVVGRRTAPRPDERILARHAALFPDRQGRPAIVVAGTGQNSRPVVARLDEDLGTVWTASLPVRVAGLAMLEPAGERRGFVVATGSGDLAVFDEDGALAWHRLLPKPGERNFDRVIRSVAAGEAEDGSFAIFLEMIGEARTYRFDPRDWPR